jgi:hypothetical protein
MRVVRFPKQASKGEPSFEAGSTDSDKAGMSATHATTVSYAIDASRACLCSLDRPRRDSGPNRSDLMVGQSPDIPNP